jgi:hypothetical protein
VEGKREATHLQPSAKVLASQGGKVLASQGDEVPESLAEVILASQAEVSWMAGEVSQVGPSSSSRVRQH